MVKRTGLIFVLGLICTGYVSAADPAGSLMADDTAGLLQKDTLITDIAAAPADPKDELKALLTESSGTATSRISREDMHPEAALFLESYSEKFTTTLENVKDKGRPQLDIIEGILEKNNLPKELKYLAVIESYLQNAARSRVGAVGAWQFMPATARNMGLRVTRKIDDRKNLAKSTQAASKYLQMLYKMYGDWLLVIAAYNGGPGKVNAAIKKSGSADFWTLQRYLPAESRNHVKKFIATHYILEGSGSITTLTKEEAASWLAEQELASAETPEGHISRTIKGRYLAAIIAEHVAMDLKEFLKANPNFDNHIAENGTYELKLPAEKMDVFVTKKSRIQEECMQILLKQVSYTEVSTMK